MTKEKLLKRLDDMPNWVGMHLGNTGESLCKSLEDLIKLLHPHNYGSFAHSTSLCIDVLDTGIIGYGTSLRTKPIRFSYTGFAKSLVMQHIEFFKELNFNDVYIFIAPYDHWERITDQPQALMQTRQLTL